LISNANDALEKLRLTALKDKTVWDGAEPLNITIRVFDNYGKPGGRLVISGKLVSLPAVTNLTLLADTGIGMTPDELRTNLGTLAKSGTTDFLARAESQDGTGTGNLIGAFGLGFYSRYEAAT
jgi:heat shock protein beta